MAAIDRIDSANHAVRAIERWKRGLGVTVIVLLSLLPGLVAGALAMISAELIGAEDWSYLTGALALVIVAPWGLGQRFVIRQIGSLAVIADD